MTTFLLAWSATYAATLAWGAYASQHAPLVDEDERRIR